MWGKEHLARSLALVAASAAVLAATLGSEWQAAAQAYPSRPVTMVVPFAAGGPNDVVARALTERMRLSLGQSVIVENVAGANGNIGTGRVARAAPDGYTLVLGHSSTHVINGAIYALPYDVVGDFAPISLIAEGPQVISARKSMPARDLKELIAWLKENPDKASLGYAGVGSPGHVAAVLFQNETGSRFLFVPYRGAGPAMQDLVAGQIDVMFTSPAVTLPPVRAGSIKAYAVTTKSRLAPAPDIPTANEAGLPGFYTSAWFALWAPKATPRDVVAKLNVATVDALADPVVRARLADLGLELFPRKQQTPEALTAFHKAEIEKWWPIIKAAGIKAE